MVMNFISVFEQEFWQEKYRTRFEPSDFSSSMWLGFAVYGHGVKTAASDIKNIGSRTGQNSNFQLINKP